MFEPELVPMHGNDFVNKDPLLVIPKHAKAGAPAKLRYEIDRCEVSGEVSVRSMDPKKSLCSICKYTFPDCAPIAVSFADGAAYNVIECSCCSVLHPAVRGT